jgi:hypothetical protein
MIGQQDCGFLVPQFGEEQLPRGRIGQKRRGERSARKPRVVEM